jgi:hypothetical protein
LQTFVTAAADGYCPFAQHVGAATVHEAITTVYSEKWVVCAVRKDPAGVETVEDPPTTVHVGSVSSAVSSVGVPLPAV